MATSPLHTWVCNYGTPEYLDYIKSTCKWIYIKMQCNHGPQTSGRMNLLQ